MKNKLSTEIEEKNLNLQQTSNPPEKNTFSINLIELKISSILQKSESKFTRKDNRIIIPSEVIENILKALNKKELDESIKKTLKEVFKKYFALNIKSAVLFKDWNAYIIKARINIKKFNWFSQEDVELALSKILEKEYSIPDIINKTIRKLKIQKYSDSELKKFITEEYKNTILLTMTKVLKSIMHEELDENILKWIAGKVFRENFEDVLDKITFIILVHKTDINSIINESIDNLLKNNFNLEENWVDFFKLNKNLEKILLKELVTSTNNKLNEKLWAAINKEFLERSLKNIILKKTLNIFANNFSKTIIEKLEEEENNNQHIIKKNIIDFLSYYSGKTEKIGNKNYEYPKFTLNHTKEILDENILHPSIFIDKLLQYIRDKKRKINNLNQKEKLKKLYSIQLKNIPIIEEEINTLTKKIKELKEKKQKLEKNFPKNETKKSLFTLKNKEESNLEKEIKEIDKEIKLTEISIREKRRKLMDLKQKENNLKKIKEKISNTEKEINKVNEDIEKFRKDLKENFTKRKKVVN